MPMSNEERARRAAQARWKGTTAEERREITAEARRSRTPESEVKRLRTMAHNYGFKLVPLDEEPDDA